jgi:hypothetical protein
MTGPDVPDGLPAAQRLDLRRVAIDDVLDRVEKSLQLRLQPDGAVRKRRSTGFRSDRATWVRVECRGLERLDSQGWGLEATRVLRGVPLPDWYAGISWFDPARARAVGVIPPQLGRCCSARGINSVVSSGLCTDVRDGPPAQVADLEVSAAVHSRPPRSTTSTLT